MTVLVAGQATAHHRVWHTAKLPKFPEFAVLPVAGLSYICWFFGVSH